MMREVRAGWRLNLFLVGLSVVAIGAPALIVRVAPPIHVLPRAVTAPRRIVPPVELPPVEPTRFVELAPEAARDANAAVPFSTAPNPTARPFRFSGSAEDLARATDCLAAAGYYEAGDDAVGERAVAQVVLNRLRHPAYPKTVCGVVFQGQERSTGCQFTFTCDGALARYRPSEAVWRRSREIAGAALGGAVYRPVGHATHYHTDWVVPYWSASLDKIVAVGTHLFFRWTGWWGTPAAFNRRQDGPEPAVAKLALLSEAHRTAAGLADATPAPETDVMDELIGADVFSAPGDEAAGEGATPSVLGRDGFLVTLPKSVAPDQWPALAARICTDRPYCKVLGWSDPARTPKQLPLTTAQVATMSFSYLRDRAAGEERRLWNCRENRRPVPAQCMRVQVYVPAGEAQPAPAAAPAAVPTRGPAELDGVRRTGARPSTGPGTPQLTPPGTSPATAP